MRYLYIFPHPDDESFGPAALMHRQISDRQEVYLLTLTKGGATKQRFRLNLSIKEMGEVRYQEMLKVKETLKLTGMTVLDLEDNGLADMDPRVLETVIEEHVRKIQPGIIVSYPVHGVSGFHDHLVTHAVVKRVFLQMRDTGAAYLKRLAFLTLPDKGEEPFMADGTFRLKNSPAELIDCQVRLSQTDVQAMKEALSCYETYQSTIAASNVVEKIGDTLYFEFFREKFDPPVSELSAGL